MPVCSVGVPSLTEGFSRVFTEKSTADINPVRTLTNTPNTTTTRGSLYPPSGYRENRRVRMFGVFTQGVVALLSCDRSIINGGGALPRVLGLATIAAAPAMGWVGGRTT